MGDMAEYYMQQGLDRWLADEEEPIVRTPRCKHCRKTGLEWTQTKTGWRLAEESGELHVCVEYRKSAAAQMA